MSDVLDRLFERIDKDIAENKIEPLSETEIIAAPTDHSGLYNIYYPDNPRQASATFTIEYSSDYTLIMEYSTDKIDFSLTPDETTRYVRFHYYKQTQVTEEHKYSNWINFCNS